MILKISFIAIICIFVSNFLKQRSEEFALIVNVCGGVLIFLLCVDELKNIIEYFTSFYEFTNIDFDFLSLLLKVVGIGYVAEFTADIAEDFGNKTIASKVLLGGKIIVCGMTLSVIEKLLSVLFALFV